MELQLSVPLYLSFLLIFLFMFVKGLKKSKAQNPKPQFPPGPWKLPLIGNLHQLAGVLPHQRLRDLARKHGPIMGLQLGERSTVVVSSPEAAKQVMKTHDLVFADRAELAAVKIMSYNSTNIAFSPYGSYWRQLRKFCILELLSAKRVQSFKTIREEEVGKLITSISTSSGLPINFTEKISHYANAIICRAAFSNKCKDQDEFLMLVKEAMELAGGFDLPDIFPSLKFLHSLSNMKTKLEKCQRRVDMILDDIIKRHKVHREDLMIDNGQSSEDLVDVLLRVQESGDLEVPITDDNVKAVILDIFGAGSDTASTAIGWTMSEMMRNPKVMEKAQAEVRQALKGRDRIDETDIRELHYLKLVIKETLRLHPPFPLLLPREARERCEISGYNIPAKTRILVNAWAIARDPEYWNNAECFEPGRFSGSSVDFKGANFEFIPFGAGRRMCPGVLFGSANIELPLAQLLYHFDWKLAHGTKPEDLDMTEVFGATLSEGVKKTSVFGAWRRRQQPPSQLNSPGQMLEFLAFLGCVRRWLG